MKLEIEIEAKPKTIFVVTIDQDESSNLRIFGEIPERVDAVIAMLDQVRACIKGPDDGE